jgi:hypothetical protein
MKKMWIFAAIVCAALMVSCSEEKKSDDNKSEKTEASEQKSDYNKTEKKSLVGTWNMVMEQGDVECILTLNENGKGDMIRREGGDYEGMCDISKWLYNSSTKTITIVFDYKGRADIVDLVIVEGSIDGDKLIAEDSVNEFGRWVFTRVK